MEFDPEAPAPENYFSCRRSTATKSNPYETPHATNGVIAPKHSDRPLAPASSSGCLAFGIASGIVACACLFQYMVLDYFVVRIRPYPAEANAYNWAFLLFPLAPALVLSAMSYTRILPLNIGMGFSAWLFGLILGVPLIVTFGICWFHFAIGGKL